MHVSLRERYIDAVLVKGIIDTFQRVANDIRPSWRLGPNEELEVDAGVGHLCSYALHGFRTVRSLDAQSVDSILNERYYLFQVRAVGHAEGDDC